MAITNSQQARQMYNQGGMGYQDPRQRYGLGSFVKKAVRGIKKVAKSPLGKAALMYAATAGLGSLSAGKGFLSKGMFSPSMIGRNIGSLSRFAPSLFGNPTTGQMKMEGMKRGFFPKMFGKMSTGQKIFAGGSAFALGAPLLQNALSKGEEVVEEVDEDYIDPYTAMMMGKFRNPQMNFQPEERFAQNNYYQTAVPAANGGRIGYADGMMVEDEEDFNMGLPGRLRDRRGYRYGGGADMGDPGRAQERADRGYGNTSRPDDRSNMEQQINHYNAMENAQDSNSIYAPGTEGYVPYQNELSQDDFYDDAFETEKRNKLMQARLNKENEEQVKNMDFENYPSRESRLEDKLYQNYTAPLQSVDNNRQNLTEAQQYELSQRLEGDDYNTSKGIFSQIPMNSVTGYPEMTSAQFGNVFKGIDDPYSLDRNQIQKYYANGGRTGYANGEMVQESVEEVRLPDEAEQMLQVEYKKYLDGGGQLPYPEFKKLVLQQMKDEQEQPQVDETIMAENVQPEAPAQGIAQLAMGGTAVPGYGTPAGTNQFGYPSGGVRVGAEEGGLMNLGGMEKDYRAEGGFVPIGKKEKADDVPARLSVNEFVFTADAVRNAGGGDIDKGAEVMENMMNNLENGGQVSEDSQGLEGAQQMYDQQQMLQSRMA